MIKCLCRVFVTVCGGGGVYVCGCVLVCVWDNKSLRSTSIEHPSETVASGRC